MEMKRVLIVLDRKVSVIGSLTQSNTSFLTFLKLSLRKERSGMGDKIQRQLFGYRI